MLDNLVPVKIEEIATSLSEQSTMPARDPRVEHFLKQYGSFTLAYSTLQPGLAHFVADWGYQAYQRIAGVTIAMGDPVCDPNRTADLLAAFLETHRKPSFFQVTEPVARFLESRRFYINHLGADMELHLPSYDFDGKKKQKLRQAMRRWARQEEGNHHEIRELSFREVDIKQVEALSAAWKETRVVRRQELRFLTRPAVFADEVEVRKFFAFRNGRLEGFVFFDPIYRDGEVIGYNTSTKRRMPDSPTGMEEAITATAIQKFQSEGREYLYLGLLPFYQLDDTGFRANRLLGWSFRFWGRVGNRFIFNFRGHNDFKHRFRGRLIKVYHASPVLENTYRMFCFNELSGVGLLSRWK